MHYCILTDQSQGMPFIYLLSIEMVLLLLVVLRTTPVVVRGLVLTPLYTPYPIHRTTFLPLPLAPCMFRERKT